MLAIDSLVIMNYATRADIPKVKYPKLSDSDGEFHIVYEGWVGAAGHINFQEIFSQLAENQLHVHVYPIQPDPNYAELAGSHPYIHYYDPLPFDQLVETMTQYDAGIIPWNLVEGSKDFIDTTIANKLFDYNLAGLPVISVNSDALKWIITNAEVGMVYDTVDDIVAAVPDLKDMEISGKLNFIEDEIDRLIGLYRVTIQNKHKPLETGLQLTAENIAAVEESQMDLITQAYFSDNGNKDARERIDAIVEACSGYVLDIGCSDGITPILCARKGLKADGLDLSEVHIGKARALSIKEEDAVKKRVRFIHGEAEHVPKPDYEYDTVVLGQVLEHVINPDAVLDEVVRVLKPGGKLLASVPEGLLIDRKHLRYYTEQTFTSQLERFCHVDDLARFGPRMLAYCHKEDETNG